MAENGRLRDAEGKFKHILTVLRPTGCPRSADALARTRRMMKSRGMVVEEEDVPAPAPVEEVEDF